MCKLVESALNASRGADVVGSVLGSHVNFLSVCSKVVQTLELSNNCINIGLSFS